MSTAIVVLLGATSGLGVLLVIAGMRGIELGEDPNRVRVSWSTASARVENLNLRVALAIGAGMVMWLVTGWPVGAVLAALGAASAPTLAGAKAKRAAAVERTEAIASWAEQLRDTIATAAGLQQAVAATAKVAPEPIRNEVALLARRLRTETFTVAVRAFADGLADPTADKVAVALIIASERQGRHLTDVLSEVANAARDQATLRLKTEAHRAQTYTASMTITTVLLTVIGGLLVLNRSYLQAFDTFTGQLVLLAVGALWCAAFVGLAQLARIDEPDRVLRVEEANLGLGARR